MKQDYTLYIYKADKRSKTGERLVSTTVWTGTDDEGMHRTTVEYDGIYPEKFGYRFEYFPKMKTVKNLMSGKEVQIDRDTPHCCDPSSETFWSM
jgi:hypothetical protein